MFCNFKSSLSTDGAVHPTIRGWDGAFHYCDVLPLMILDHSFECCFGLLPRTRHNQFVVFPGEKIQHELSDCWVAGAEHRFRIARAILELEPNQDWTRGLTEGFFNRR